MQAYQCNVYLTADTDRADLDVMDKKRLMEFALCVRDEIMPNEDMNASADAICDWGPQMASMKKSDLVALVYGNVVRPVQEKRKESAARRLLERERTLATEKSEGIVETRRTHWMKAALDQATAESERVATAKAKIVADPFNAIASYADDLWIAEYKLYFIQALARNLSSDETANKTESEMLEMLKDWQQSELDRCLRDGISRSTNQLSNVRDDCERVARQWFVRCMNVLLKYWSKDSYATFGCV